MPKTLKKSNWITHASNAWIQDWLKYYSRKYFGGTLNDVVIIFTPKSQVRSLMWDPYGHCWLAGGAYTSKKTGKRYIFLHPRFRWDLAGSRITTLHEMCHFSSKCKNHGKRFQAEKQRILDLGAFTPLL